MASSVIHIAVANEINKVLKKDNKLILIGSIAPDIAKHLGEEKAKSHFILEKDSDIPNLDGFLHKYKNNLNDDFVLGYYIHLYTDYLWFKDFVPSFTKNGFIRKLNGEKERLDNDKLYEYIYNDYTNLNISLIDYYNLDLKLFYDKTPYIENIIKEIPVDKIKLIIDKAGIIIENSKKTKEYIFDISLVNEFINNCVSEIINNLNEIFKS